MAAFSSIRRGSHRERPAECVGRPQWRWGPAESLGIAAEKVLRGYFWIDVDGQIMLGRGLQSYPPLLARSLWHAPAEG